MWLVRSWFIGLVAAISLLAQGASKAEPVKIRVSWIAPLSNWASLLMEKKELARHMGRSYILEPVRYAGTPQMITALANNELDPANHAEVVAIASRLTKQPPERLGWVFTKQDYYHVPGMRPDLEALQRNVALVKELGLIGADTDVKKHSDLTVLDDAAKRLK